MVSNRNAAGLTSIGEPGFMEARMGIEPMHGGFAGPSLTTWVPRLNFVGPRGELAATQHQTDPLLSAPPKAEAYRVLVHTEVRIAPASTGRNR